MGIKNLSPTSRCEVISWDPGYLLFLLGGDEQLHRSESVDGATPLPSSVDLGGPGGHDKSRLIGSCAIDPLQGCTQFWF